MGNTADIVLEAILIIAGIMLVWASIPEVRVSVSHIKYLSAQRKLDKALEKRQSIPEEIWELKRTASRHKEILEVNERKLKEFLKKWGWKGLD